MPAIPVTGKRLSPFHQGSEFRYGPVVFTVEAGLPDPATWTSLKLWIHVEDGTDIESTAQNAAGGSTLLISGSGPWTVTAYFPLTAEQTDIDIGDDSERDHVFRIIFGNATWRKALVQGLVNVLKMHEEEWPA